MFLARVYSHHSLLSALPKIERLIENAKQKGYTSIALTDKESGAGFVKFYETAKKQEVKPVLGVTLAICNTIEKKGEILSKIAILAKNKQGYLKLLELITTAKVYQDNPKPHLLLTNLQNSQDLFILIPTEEHEIADFFRKKDWKSIEEVLKIYLKFIENQNLLLEVFLPLRDEDLAENQAGNLKLLEIAKKYGIRLILSPAPRYLEPEEAESFRVVLAIKKQKKLFDIILNRDYNLPSVRELKEKFAYLPPSVLDTADLESQIDLQIRTDYDKHAEEAFFPPFTLEPGQNAKDRLTWETYIGLVNNFDQTNFQLDYQQEALKKTILQKLTWKNLSRYLK